MSLLNHLRHILFFDVESVSMFQSYHQMDEHGQALWDRKSEHLHRNIEDIDHAISYTQKAGIFAEFSKVACISVGYLALADDTDNAYEFRMKTFYDYDESVILNQFTELLIMHYNDVSIHSLCGHNIREFDIPFLSRRMLVNQIMLPAIMDIRYAKPWEREHLIDTMQDWKFGDYKNYTSLDSLCYTFGVESPKNAMSGSDVHEVYYSEDNLAKIAQYCEQDVTATMRVFLRLQNIDIGETEIILKSVTT